MRSPIHRQQGSVIVTVCLVLLFLLGFMGVALDFGHLFVVKTELQTAMDSCALAAAQELDGQSDAITRAVSAGTQAGNANRVNFQSATWSNQGQVTASDISFMTAAYAPTTAPAQAKYAQCQHTQPLVQMWLLQFLGLFSGNATDFPGTGNVLASAVATRSSAQSTCPMPLGLKPKTGSTPPNYGFTAGEWVTLLMGPGAATNGQIGWSNLDGSNSASETDSELHNHCGSKIGDPLGTPGVQTSVVPTWNARFGIYKNNSGPSIDNPDFTGYAYTTHNWPAGKNAYNGTPGVGSDPTAANFVTKRLAFASCDDTGTRLSGANSCESITGLSLTSFNKVAAPGPSASGGHKQFGTNRRIATVPVVNSSSHLIDYVCMLILQPLSIPMAQVQLEFIGNAAELGSPCTTSGLPGGTAGPLVPVLVR